MIIMVWRLIGSAFEVLGAAPDLAFPTWGGMRKCYEGTFAAREMMVHPYHFQLVEF